MSCLMKGFFLLYYLYEPQKKVLSWLYAYRIDGGYYYYWFVGIDGIG